MNRIYNEVWAGNWGFSPMSDKELLESAFLLRHIGEADLVFFIQRGEEPVGVFLILPDLNPVFKHCGGRIRLSALPRLWRDKADAPYYRLILFGIKKDYHQLGVPMIAINHIYRTLSRKKRFEHIELAWSLEDHEPIGEIMRMLDLKPRKRHRIYRKELR
jgi:hypothetical protein